MAKQNKSTGCGALVFTDTKAFCGWKVQKGYTQNLLIKGGLGIGIQPDFQMSIAGGNEQIECDTKLSEKSAKLVLTALIEQLVQMFWRGKFDVTAVDKVLRSQLRDEDDE